MKNLYSTKKSQNKNPREARNGSSFRNAESNPQSVIRNSSLFALLFAFYAMVGGVWGQAATATWALTSSETVSTSGNITATNESIGAGVTSVGFTSTTGHNVTDCGGGVCTPNSNDFYEFTVTPNCGSNMSVTSITFTAKVNNGTRCLQLFQSVDGAAETQIGANFSTTTTSTDFTTGTLNIGVTQGKTIRLRLYVGNDQNGRNTFLKNFVVNTTTTTVSQLTPAVSISSNDADNTFCSGTNVTFTASASNTGGGTVTYQWKLNGGNVGTNATTYSSTSLANNDQVSCSISISGGSCLAATTANSSSITNIVNTLATADAGPALSAILQGATSAQMGGSVGGSATGGTWSGGAGTWANASNPSTATYTAGANESGNITLTLTTSGGSCGTTATKTITVSVAPATIPLSVNFTSSNPFTFVNGSQTNSWAYGSATGNPANSIYISNDGGTTNAYTTSSAISTVQAYRDITVPNGASTANFTFNWKSDGESGWDYFRVWLVPSTFNPQAGTQITAAASGGAQVGTNFGLQTTWQTYTNNTLDISSFANSTMRLVFEWRNDGSGGTAPPAAIDNVNLSFPTPTVTSFSPASSCVGSSITLTGTNFSSITGVSFNGVAASTYTVNNSTQITVTVPAATTGTISVTGLGGTGTSASNFTVSSTPSTPTVSVTGSSTINVGGTSALSATTSGGTLNWYTQASGGSIVNTGSSYDLPVQCSSGTTTYYVEEVGDGSCNSPRGSAAITVRPVITSNPSNSLICTSGGSVTLSTQLTGASGITWSPSTNLSTTSGASTVASPTATIQYSVSATVTGCPTINATQNVGVIEGVSFIPTASPTAVCEGATSVLTSNLNSSNFSVSSTTYAPIAEPGVGVTTLATGGAASVALSGGSLDDGGWADIPIGFTYNFFGNTYSTIAAGTNGLLMFGTVPGYTTAAGNLGQFSYSSNASTCNPVGASTGQVFPNCNNPANIIALMANDLELDGGSIKYWNDGIAPTRRFIIQYSNVPHYSSGGAASSTITAQCILYETTGNVEIHVASAAAGTGNNAKTIGLQDATRTIGATAPGRQAFTTAITTPEAWRFVAGATYTYQWSTAGSNIGGATSGTYTTAALNTPGTIQYTVAATNPNTQCASTANVSVTVNARPAAPNSTGDVTACSNAGSQNLTVTTYTDVTADWYNATTGGTLLTNNNLTHATSSAGTYYAESQNTVTGCTSTSRTAVTLNVNTSPNAPTVTTPVTYCQGAIASALTATAGVGNTLKWYTAAPNFPSITGATLTGSAPTPSTSTATSTDYFVSQTAGACESQLAKIVVTVNASPATPTASDPSAYCQNAVATQLTATAAANCTLYWYSDPTTSAGQNTTAPTPLTATAGTFYFYVANRNNTTTCEGSRKTITVTVNPSISASVTNSASSTSACGGGSITFTATPTNGGASPTYQWYLNNVAAGTNSPTYVLALPANGNVIKVTMTPSAQTCLTNPSGSTSNEVTLTSSASTPTVSIQSTASSAICPGTSVTFSVNSSTNMGSTPSYVWKKGGVAISGATNSTYTTTGLVNGDQITLEMTSSLSGGCLTQTSATSSAITTTVNAATAISSQPIATSACLGSSANFSVTATGQGTLTYQWKKAGTNITGNGSAITNALTLSVGAGDAANYTVDVTGSCGTVSSSSVALTINTATSISGQPSAVTQCAGTTANFSVTAAGQGTLSYDWRKDGVAINGATSSTLAVSNISSSNAGQYSVIVTGGCGSVTSNNALLTVNAATTIATHPSASTLCAGNTANFSVTATGTGSLTYQWKRDATNVGTGSSLSVSNAQSINAGTYTVDVSGTCGTAISNGALLTVNATTAITTQPVGTAGCEGQNTTFTVAANGTGALSYQWKYGSTNVGTNSASYNIPSTTTANDGSYSVVVTGSCGSAPSNTVTLNVYPSPSTATISTADMTDVTLCGKNQVSVAANAPGAESTGVWSVVGNWGIIASSDTDPSTTFTANNAALGGTAKKLVWSHIRTTNGNNCYTRDTITVDFKQPVTSSISVDLTSDNSWLWGGLTSSTWGTAANWYKWDGSKWLAQSSFTPSSSDRVFMLINSTAGLCVSASNTPALGTNPSIDDLDVGAGQTLTLNNNSLTINGDLINDGAINAGTGTVVFSATSGNQTIGGTQPVTLNNLTLNKDAGNLVVSTPVTVNGTLTMTKGNISNSSLITLGSSSSATGTLSHTAGTITGAFRRYFADVTGTDYYFPIGNSTYTRGVTVNMSQTPESNQYITAEYKSGTPQVSGSALYDGLPLTTADGQLIQNYDNEGYWQIDPKQYDSGIDTKNYTISLQMNSITGVNDYTKSRIIKADGPSHVAWSALTHVGATGSNANYTLSGSGNGFSWFNGGGDNNNNPLPVELVSFSGLCDNGIINLSWQTASEFNSSHFDVEKSRDGENWQLLSTIPSAGTSNELITYQSTDQNGTEGNNYFRLRQVDIDGTEKLYDPMNVSCSEVTTGYFSSFPNPSGSAFQVIVNNKDMIGQCVMNIVDASGKVIEQRQIEVKDGINMFVIDQELTTGIYFLNISNGTKSSPILRHVIK